jgi:hypothetical protein
MTDAQQALWHKIEAYQLDQPGVHFPFSQRLARENGWTPRFTQRVITEYKRFIFLCCVRDAPSTPSDAVDQAWHLHMTYTKAYWQDLCGQTLGRELHHHPTEGGPAEADKFDHAYIETLKAYRVYFGEDAPVDIWPPATERFAARQFQRVETGRYRLLHKERLTGQGALFGYAVAMFAVVFLVIAPDWRMRLGLLGLLVLIGVLVIHDSLARAGGRAGKGQRTQGEADGGCDGGVTWLILAGDAGHGHGDGGDASGGDGSGGDAGCGSGCSGCGGD